MERERFLELMNGLSRTVLLSQDWIDALHAMAFEIKERVGADDCHILGWDEEYQNPIPIATTTVSDVPFSEFANVRYALDVTRTVLREGYVLPVDNIQKSPYIDVQNASRFPYQCGIAIPLISDDHKLGAVIVVYNELRHFTPLEIERAEQAGNQIALTLWTFQQSLETQKLTKQSNTLAKIALALSETERNGIGQILQLIVDSARELMPQAEKSVIHLLDEEEQILIARAVSGFNSSDIEFHRLRMQMGEGIAGQVMREGLTINVKDVQSDPHFLIGYSQQTFQSLIVAPVKSGGRPIGTISVESTLKNAFSSRDVDLLDALALQSAIGFENTRLFETLQTSLQEEKKMRSQLLQSERLALFGRLLASVSHELNNPLQAIQYGLFLLRDDTGLSDQAKQDLDVIIAESERMVALVERLRSAYRPVRVRDIKSISLNKLVEDVCALISIHMRHKEIVLNFSPENDLPNILGLPDQIRQVLLNIFLNAIEVMEPGGSLTIETRCFPLQKEVMVVVKDTGPGIDPEIMPQIFDAFITSKETGTGIGLTITYDIIQQHGGRIEAENDPEGGAIFKVWLPFEE